MSVRALEEALRQEIQITIETPRLLR